MGGLALISSSCFVVVVLIFVLEAELGSARITFRSKDYISWDDLRVSDRRREDVNLRQESGKVIVVDGSGFGDSVTVQGAIDMVPDGNSDRVKIVIRPGTYR